jgi:hypothetical protein
LVYASERLPTHVSLAARHALAELIGKLQRGTYTFRVIDVQLAGHSFDAAGSVLEARVYVK